jgi:hypothetical protein
MSNVIPERPILISPTLAATIGLEEAVLLHLLSEWNWRRPGQPLILDSHWQQEAVPFWTQQKFICILNSLIQLGMVEESSTISSSPQVRLTCGSDKNPSTSIPQLPTRQPLIPRYFTAQGGGNAQRITADWKPDAATIELCVKRGVPADFAYSRIAEFVLYWQERGKPQYSFQQSFLSWTVAQWEKQRTYQQVHSTESSMSRDWLPSEEALSILEMAKVNTRFIEDAIPEFILYWREKGTVANDWNTKFVSHVRRQWHKITHDLLNDATPKPLPVNFEPHSAFFEVLAMANIDRDFALALLPEFILYWQDRGEALSSWNTKFLQHVKYHWGQRDNKIDPTVERLTDRSWAD